jgi:hypothetical protein
LKKHLTKVYFCQDYFNDPINSISKLLLSLGWSRCSLMVPTSLGSRLHQSFVTFRCEFLM